ncbi:hypothetical protein MYK68_02500 [Gordonia sp. PP30]|uniref:hypothetical protein n=1 Tax=Gordonia sp. PP30 TaxID=2935861 RepID=UPI001FFEF4A9|nr:hypothetical protein [Gordonia sp. PP30]UQE75513.1 hypothetical protein MYK68_02500 [Gordonia sp. PP30]
MTNPPPPGQFPPPSGQDPQGQYPPPPQPGQVPPGQFPPPGQVPPAGQFPPSAVPPPGYGAPQPAGRSGMSTGLIAGIIGAVVVIAVLIGVLLWQPWKSGDAGKTQSFTLDRGVKVKVDVPGGWKALTITDDSSLILAILPSDETRTDNDSLDQATRELETDPNAKPVHAVAVHTEECPSSVSDLAAGTWRTKPVSTDTEDNAATASFPAILRVDSTYCLGLVGIDVEHGTAVKSTTGVDLAKKLVDKKQITASR